MGSVLVPFERCGDAAAEGTPIAPSGHFPLEGGSKPEEPRDRLLFSSLSPLSPLQLPPSPFLRRQESTSKCDRRSAVPVALRLLITDE